MGRMWNLRFTHVNFEMPVRNLIRDGETESGVQERSSGWRCPFGCQFTDAVNQRGSLVQEGSHPRTETFSTSALRGQGREEELAKEAEKSNQLGEEIRRMQDFGL